MSPAEWTAVLVWGLAIFAGVLMVLVAREPRCPLPARVTNGAFVCRCAAGHAGPCRARLAYPGRLVYLWHRTLDWPRRWRQQRAYQRRVRDLVDDGLPF